MKNDKLWLLIDGVLKKLHHAKFWTTSINPYKEDILKAIEILELARKKIEDEKWELNKKHWFCESKSRLAILERVQLPLKSSYGCQLFSDFKLSRNLIDSGIENDLKIDPKNLPWISYSTSADSFGRPWGPPGVQGHEIDDSGRQLESIFDVRRSKSGSKSTRRGSQKLIPTYIIENRKPNRSRYLPKLENHVKWPNKHDIALLNFKKIILLKIDAQSFPEADFEIYYRVRNSASI